MSGIDKPEDFKDYYGKNYRKAFDTYHHAQANAKDAWSKKHPDADLEKFIFQPNLNDDGTLHDVDILFKSGDDFIDVESSLFRKNYVKYLTHPEGSGKPKLPPKLPSSWPRMWDSKGSVKELALDDKSDLSTFPKVRVTNAGSFMVYVTASDYFLSEFSEFSEFPEISSRLPKTIDFDITKPYFAAICGAYIATYLSGISMEHLEFKPGVHPVVSSIMNFHVYFWVMRFTTHPKLIKPYLHKLDVIKKHIAKKAIWSQKFDQSHANLGTWKQHNRSAKNPRYARNTHGAIAGIYYDHLDSENLISYNDFTRFIPDLSDGLTPIGLKLLNESIEAYVYAVLGSQAKTRVSIVGGTAGSLETQQEFRGLVNDAILNHQVSVWILNMNRSIMDTNVVQDLAVTPSTWLIPSNMIILRVPIPGYNNLLKTATKAMKFGVNSNVNYKAMKKELPRKAHQSPTGHLGSLSTLPRSIMRPAVKPVKPVMTPINNHTTKPILESRGHSEFTIALVLALSTFTVFRYVV